MIIIKDLEKLEKYGFEYKDEYCELHYDYDCGDNRTYIYVEIPSGILTVVPSLYGDCPAEKYLNQLDIIVQLVIDGVATLNHVPPYWVEKEKI